MSDAVRTVLRGTRGWIVASAVIFGAGFGTAYPVSEKRIYKAMDALLP